MKLFAYLFATLLAGPALADDYPPKALTVTVTGVNGENLSDTPVTDAINMWDATFSNQLSLSLVVTPGTTTSLAVKCAESETSASGTFAQISICDGNAAAACAPDVRTYTLSDYTTVGSVKVIDSSWPVKKKYVQCTLTGSGTGTVVMTGTRSWQ